MLQQLLEHRIVAAGTAGMLDYKISPSTHSHFKAKNWEIDIQTIPQPVVKILGIGVTYNQ